MNHFDKCYPAVQQDRLPKLKTSMSPIWLGPNRLKGKTRGQLPTRWLLSLSWWCLVRFAKAEYMLQEQWLSLYEQRKGLHGFQIKQQSSLLQLKALAWGAMHIPKHPRHSSVFWFYFKRRWKGPNSERRKQNKTSKASRAGTSVIKQRKKLPSFSIQQVTSCQTSVR